MTDLLFDGLRVAHMASFAVGIGTATFLELHITKRFRHRFDADAVRLLLMGHGLIKAAVVGLWVTGLSLIYFRLVVFGDPFSPKLAAKLATVTALSVNMMIIERFLIPRVLRYENRSLSQIPSRTLALFGGIAGFSAGAWLSAMLLGGIGQLKSMDVAHLSGFLMPLLALATVVGVLAGLAAGHVSGNGLRERLVPGKGA